MRFGDARLLRHVRDRLDPRVGDHPDRDPEQEVAPRRRGAEVHLVDEQLRVEDEEQADRRRAPTCVSRSAIASTRLSRADSSVPLTLSAARQREQADPER